MNTLKKALVGTAAATAMAVSATPAQAKHGDDGISAGEVIAGAVVLGGLAAILTSGKKDRYSDYNYDRSYRGDRYKNRGYDYGQRIRPRRAVNKCVRQAEQRASRWGRADVTDIRDVKRTRYGYKIKGRIAVRDNYRARGYNSRHYRSGYDRGYKRGYHDTGKFTCYVDGRRVSDIRFKGLKRW